MLRLNFHFNFIARTTNLPRRQGKSPSLGCDTLKNVDVLKLVSQKMSSNVTWLIDNNLPPLTDHTTAERNFVKLDNVFAVSFCRHSSTGSIGSVFKFVSILKSLGIYDVTTAALLETFFVPYIWCPNCSSPCSSPCSSEQSSRVSNDWHIFYRWPHLL